jgi:2-polyprenyl-3-methyl-5-hydroxy-6-metoxy-1,4-benzoquinol methylase
MYLTDSTVECRVVQDNLGGDAARRWAEALGRWAIPEWILARAVESPWDLPVSLFAAEAAPAGALQRLAAESLPPGGTVLDVGCGGGRASLPFAGKASFVAGVDESPEMLKSFAKAAASLGVGFEVTLGRWPDVARGDGTDEGIGAFDVVVCRNVVYNVSEIAPFVSELAAHARCAVVVELTEKHPTAWLAPLWKSYWGVDLPDEPTSTLFAEVLAEIGYTPEVHLERRPPTKAIDLGDDYVSFVRRRLCLDPSRNGEVRSAIERLWPAGPPVLDAVVVRWAGSA